MKLKSTQFNFVNSENDPKEESEEWNAIMEESETLFTQEEQRLERCPSDDTIKRILDFARSHKVFSTRSLNFIDFRMN